MCGRYEFSDEKDIEEIHKILHEINSKYNGSKGFKTGEIFPTNIAPVLALQDGKPALSLMQWGFPRFDAKGVIINAKSETAAQKNMFKKPLVEKRCVIPSTGFFEWHKKSNSNKDKFLFTEQSSPMVYLAGIYSLFKNGDTLTERFVIFTTKANQTIEDVHDRMPVILYKQELKEWLSDSRFIDFVFNRNSVILERKLV